ncbi:MAG: hypothetical protein WDO56_37220 [Gammaproteobacteria bacterium]
MTVHTHTLAPQSPALEAGGALVRKAARARRRLLGMLNGIFDRMFALDLTEEEMKEMDRKL